MISLADAFGSETTFAALLYVAIPGHWDPDNNWVPETYAPGFKLSVTGIPDSARDALLAGKWDPIGELLEAADATTTTAARLAYFSFDPRT